MKLNTTIAITPLKPRNPVAIAANQRAAGVHRRSASGLRQQARREMRRELQHLRPSP